MSLLEDETETPVSEPDKEPETPIEEPVEVTPEAPVEEVTEEVEEPAEETVEVPSEIKSKIKAINPDNEEIEVEVEDLEAFAVENELDYEAIKAVLEGSQKTHKKWRFETV